MVFSQRLRTRTFRSSEDIDDKFFSSKNGFNVSRKFSAHSREAQFPLKTGLNEDVERVRRAHLNDLENILPFFCLGLLYIFTNPAPSTAVLVFRLYLRADSL